MPACPSHPSARARPRPFALVGPGNQQYTFHPHRRRSSAAVPAGDRAASEGSADANFHPIDSPRLPVTMLYPQTPTQQPKFALEISEDEPPLHYELVPQGQLVRSESLSFAPGPYLHLRSGRTTADAKKNLTSAIMLAYHVDGDAVAISASVVFGAVDNNSGSCPMAAGHPKQEIGTYSLHQNDSVVLQEMEQFGLQPWT